MKSLILVGIASVISLTGHAGASDIGSAAFDRTAYIDKNLIRGEWTATVDAACGTPDTCQALLRLLSSKYKAMNALTTVNGSKFTRVDEFRFHDTCRAPAGPLVPDGGYMLEDKFHLEVTNLYPNQKSDGCFLDAKGLVWSAAATAMYRFSLSYKYREINIENPADAETACRTMGARLPTLTEINELRDQFKSASGQVVFEAFENGKLIDKSIIPGLSRFSNASIITTSSKQQVNVFNRKVVNVYSMKEGKEFTAPVDDSNGTDSMRVICVKN